MSACRRPYGHLFQPDSGAYARSRNGHLIVAAEVLPSPRPRMPSSTLLAADHDGDGKPLLHGPLDGKSIFGVSLAKHLAIKSMRMVPSVNTPS